jgi:hypothetical protein
VKRSARLLSAVLTLGLALGCSGRSAGPSRETLLPLLQKEAASLKSDGEKVDPVLGVNSTWTVEGIDLKEQPGNEATPWLGTIRFKIVSRTKDEDGGSVNDESQKQFEYAWNTTLGKWVFQYKPSSPSPRPN